MSTLTFDERNNNDEIKGRATKKLIDPCLLRIALYFETRVFIKITAISKNRRRGWGDSRLQSETFEAGNRDTTETRSINFRQFGEK